MKKYDVVQFAESHKWAGCLGIVEENNHGRLLIGVPVPEKGIAYIYAFEDDVYYIGVSLLELGEQE